MSGCHNRRARLLCLVVCASGWCGRVLAAESEDLTSLSLEQLMDEPVTSVSKKETKIGQAPAAITVVTQDDLRRMGITTLPEALRLVPGMDVAQIGAGQWAVSSRGFNSEFSTKLLVLIDGRSVYTPTTAGVFWDSQDVVIADVDRIEVIRGPGATLWGANAVNGVINVITKSSADTQGGLVSAGGGSEDRSLVTARYGGENGPDLHWRASAQYSDRAGFDDVTGGFNPGGWQIAHGGMRVDWKPGTADDVMVQADAYGGHTGMQSDVISLTAPYVTSVTREGPDNGADILGRWTRIISEQSAFTLQMYFDHVVQGVQLSSERRDVFDFDAQHRFALNSFNDVVWGVGYRRTSVGQAPDAEASFAQNEIDFSLFNVFVQDEIILVPNRLHAIVGSKFEHNNLIGWSPEPNARLLWTPGDRESVWAAVSRASRTPSLFELEGTATASAFEPPSGGPPVAIVVKPNPDLQTEALIAYELGYRFEPVNSVSVDISVFLNRYNGEIGLEPGGLRFVTSPAPAHEELQFVEENADDGKTFGIEPALQWQVTRSWKLMGSYTWLRMHLWPDQIIEHESPQNQFQVRSYLDLPWHLELNTAAYYVDSVVVPYASAYTRIPAYVRADAGIVWKPNPAISVGLWGRNLFSGNHLEFASTITTLLSPVPPSWLLKVTWNF
jgi:iron complex outermembrane recepter protein